MKQGLGAADALLPLTSAESRQRSSGTQHCTLDSAFCRNHPLTPFSGTRELNTRFPSGSPPDPSSIPTYSYSLLSPSTSPHFLTLQASQCSPQTPLGDPTAPSRASFSPLPKFYQFHAISSLHFPLEAFWGELLTCLPHPSSAFSPGFISLCQVSLSFSPSFFFWLEALLSTCSALKVQVYLQVYLPSRVGAGRGGETPALPAPTWFGRLPGPRGASC